MAQQKIKTRYQGRYQSSTYNPVNKQDIVVNAARFTPIDLLATAYNSDAGHHGRRGAAERLQHRQGNQ
ncbi:MAG: hypothetical protein RBT71_01200 [Flavobacteriales bacterium]|jgi:hypothetical protein|nr:hypothetical protein [Flavobacteriales bacterium]